MSVLFGSNRRWWRLWSTKPAMSFTPRKRAEKNWKSSWRRWERRSEKHPFPHVFQKRVILRKSMPCTSEPIERESCLSWHQQQVDWKCHTWTCDALPTRPCLETCACYMRANDVCSLQCLLCKYISIVALSTHRREKASWCDEGWSSRIMVESRCVHGRKFTLLEIFLMNVQQDRHWGYPIATFCCTA